MKKLIGLLFCLAMSAHGAVQQNVFVTNQVGQVVSGTAVELGNYASRPQATNAAIGVLKLYNVVTNGYDQNLLLSNSVHSYGKFYSESNLYSTTNWTLVDNVTNLFMPAVGQFIDLGSTNWFAGAVHVGNGTLSIGEAAGSSALSLGSAGNTWTVGGLNTSFTISDATHSLFVFTANDTLAQVNGKFNAPNGFSSDNVHFVKPPLNSPVNGQTLVASGTGGQLAWASGGGVQTPWTSDIDGAGFSLTNVGQISAAGITNTGVGATGVVVTDANGKETKATLVNLTLVGTTLTAAGGGGSQTPWTSDINGGGFALTNVGSMIITGELDVASLRVTNIDSSIWIASSLGNGTNTSLFAGTNYGSVGRTNFSWMDVNGFHQTNTSAANQGVIISKGNITNDQAITVNGGILTLDSSGPSSLFLNTAGIDWSVAGGSSSLTINDITHSVATATFAQTTVTLPGSLLLISNTYPITAWSLLGNSGTALWNSNGVALYAISTNSLAGTASTNLLVPAPAASGGGGTNSGPITLTIANNQVNIPCACPVGVVTNSVLPFRLTLTGNTTITNATGMLDGQVIRLQVIQDSTGNRTLSFWNGFTNGSPANTSYGSNSYSANLTGTYISTNGNSISTMVWEYYAPTTTWMLRAADWGN